MKHKTLQKVIMTTMGLAASLALSALAGQPGQDGPKSISAKGAKITRQQPVHATAAALGSVKVPSGPSVQRRL